MTFIKHISWLALFLIVALSILFFALPEDLVGSIGDTALKMFGLAFKVFVFSLGLKFFFGFLDFSLAFKEASLSEAHSQKAIAIALIIIAWSLVVFHY